MATQRPYLRLFIVGIAVILSSTAGIAGIIGWLPAPTGGSSDTLARIPGKCAECGVIVSVREMDAHAEGAGLDESGGVVARHEITIRMADRSSRVISDASPASWRPGEPVILIDGANSANR